MDKARLTIKKTRLVYFTLILLNTLFLIVVGVSWLLNVPPFHLEKKMAYMVSTFAILLIGLLISGGVYFYSRARRKVAYVDPADFKLSAFFKASVIQFAFFNLAGNVAIMAFLLTRDFQNLFFFLVTLVFLILNPPGFSRLSTEFKYRIQRDEVPEEANLN